LMLLLCQMAYLPGTVHLEDEAIPWCLLDCPKYWADEADLVDEQSSEDDGSSDEDVPGTELYPCCCLLLSKVTAKLAPFTCVVSTVVCECA